MTEVSNNNKRIAKNTLALYLRMFIAMFIGLYTSRIILQQLGIVDYGIYEVVGGVVSMFGFLNGTLTAGTQRFLTYALGLGDADKVRLTFSTAFNIHLILSFIVGLLIFSVGTYLISSKLVIPTDKLDAAYFSLYCCTIISVLTITQAPYTGLVIAHERMNIYAYISILETLLKLGIAFLLPLGDIDKLKLYAFLMLLVQIITIFSYRIYCRKSFKECRISYQIDLELAKNIGSFSGWNIIGSISNVMAVQGFGIILNLFFGPVINTAQGLANKVNALCSQFISSFQSAINPQIVKYYATNQKEEMIHLLYNNLRLSGVMILLVVVPFFSEIDFLLDLWLGHYPEQTILFSRIILIQAVIIAMYNPLVMAIFATGKMKIPNILAGGVQLLILPIAYIMLFFNIKLQWILITSLLPWILAAFIDVCLLKRYIGLSILGYFRNSYMIVIPIGVIMLIIPYILNLYIEQGWPRLIYTTLSSILVCCILSYKFALSPAMRQMLIGKITTILKKLSN